MNSNIRRKRIVSLSLLSTALFAVVLLTLMSSAPTATLAKHQCVPIPDPRFPGLTECTYFIAPEQVFANPPDPQKMPLWCWAASMSMVFTLQEHPISQEAVVIQNFGSLVNASSGPFPVTEARLNGTYRDANGKVFKSTATRLMTPTDAANALKNNVPIIYSTQTHATVQLSLTLQQAPGGPVVVRGGTIWDPLPGVGLRNMGPDDVMRFVAAWAMTTRNVEQ